MTTIQVSLYVLSNYVKKELTKLLTSLFLYKERKRRDGKSFFYYVTLLYSITYLLNLLKFTVSLWGTKFFPWIEYKSKIGDEEILTSLD